MPGCITPQMNYFNPRSPCGERRCLPQLLQGHGAISIHALLAESDRMICTLGTRQKISIHALLAESDLGSNDERRRTQLDFNPRSPCGERPGSTRAGGRTSFHFNPRSPCGERQQIPPNWPYRFCLKCQFKDGEKSKKAKGSASAQASSPAYEKNKVRIPWGDFECFRFAPIK